MSLSTETKVRVRYSETDQMGVVHHGNYAQYLELARIDWLEKLGASYKTMEENGVMLPVLELSLKYLKSAFFDDEITIKTILRETPSVKITFDFEIYNQKKDLLTTGFVILVFMNSSTKRPIKCPQYLLDKIASHTI